MQTQGRSAAPMIIGWAGGRRCPTCSTLAMSASLIVDERDLTVTYRNRPAIPSVNFDALFGWVAGIIGSQWRRQVNGHEGGDGSDPAR